MKTIIVIYTKEKKLDFSKSKKYTFNTNSNLQIGDLIKTPNYNVNIQIVDILDETFKYYDPLTGELSNISNNKSEIKRLELTTDDEKDDDIIYGKLIK